MSRGKRYESEAQLNYKKVFAVFIAFVVLVMSIIMIKNVLTTAKNTKPVEIIDYFALYQDNKWGIVGSNGQTVIEPFYQEMPIVIDKTRDVFLCTYDIDDEKEMYKTKVINSKNEEIFTQYDKVEALENYDKDGNVWYEKNILKVEKDNLWGIINLDGNAIIEIKYDNIETLKGFENSLVVEKDKKVGLMNNKGIKIADIEYKEIQGLGTEYKNGYITIDDNGKYGVISSSGESILENKYDKVVNLYSSKYFVVKVDDKQKLINTKGEDILTQGFEEITQIATSGIVYKKENKIGLMDFEGNILINPIYDELKEINTDIFSAKKENKYGIIKNDNTEKVGFKYENVTYNQKAGIYIAENNDYTSTILNTEFEEKLTGIISELNIENGYMKIKSNNEYKFYNFKFEEKEKKEILTKNKLYSNKENGKYGFINEKGEVIVDYIYDDITEFNEYGFAGINKDGKWGSINKEGEIVIEPTYNLDEYLVINFIGKWHLGLDLNMNYYCEK